MELAFAKWQGLGNDFILVDEAHVAGRDLPALARQLCDRRRGIGGDGLILTRRAPGSPQMVVYNADGSRPEMCGNGVRCVAAAWTQTTGQTRFDVETDAGPRGVTVSGSGAQFVVSVAMGKASFGEPIQAVVDGKRYLFDNVSMGNPHAILWEELTAEARDIVGPLVEKQPAEGTNVEFACLKSGGIDVVVWERGVGYTQACGTGACATAAAAKRRGLIAPSQPVVVKLPGGPLEITVATTDDVQMSGPASLVFSGTVEV